MTPTRGYATTEIKDTEIIFSESWMMGFVSRLADVYAVMHQATPLAGPYRGAVQVGVDLGTTYLVVLVLDENQRPLAGAYQFAQVVRDGLVVDFVAAVELVRQMKRNLEEKLGFELSSAATAYPPGVSRAEVRAAENVLYQAGLRCSGLIDEPSAANKVLGLEQGAVVDIGGGTTGVAVVKNGQIIYTADEPTGGVHFSLVIAGAKNISFEEAERLKKDRASQPQLLPLVRPVMEKVGVIINRHLAGHAVESIHLVGGSSSFLGIDRVVAEVTGRPAIVSAHPMFVTPLGIALSN